MLGGLCLCYYICLHRWVCSTVSCWVEATVALMCVYMALVSGWRYVHTLGMCTLPSLPKQDGGWYQLWPVRCDKEGYQLWCTCSKHLRREVRSVCGCLGMSGFPGVHMAHSRQRLLALLVWVHIWLVGSVVCFVRVQCFSCYYGCSVCLAKQHVSVWLVGERDVGLQLHACLACAC